MNQNYIKQTVDLSRKSFEAGEFPAGAPLSDAVMYASMESCLMCSAKMYWAGITKVRFVIPKSKTNTLYAYEDDRPMSDHLGKFNTPLESIHDDTLLDEALELYEAWVKKIEAK